MCIRKLNPLFKIKTVSIMKYYFTEDVIPSIYTSTVSRKIVN